MEGRPAVAERPAGVMVAIGGELVWVNAERPQSVYLAEPGSECEVEVYGGSDSIGVASCGLPDEIVIAAAIGYMALYDANISPPSLFIRHRAGCKTSRCSL